MDLTWPVLRLFEWFFLSVFLGWTVSYWFSGRLSSPLRLLWSTYDAVMNNQFQQLSSFFIVCEKPENQVRWHWQIIVKLVKWRDAWQHKTPSWLDDAIQNKFIQDYCKMELFQRESKVGKIKQANLDWRKWEFIVHDEVMRRPRERFGAAWRSDVEFKCVLLIMFNSWLFGTRLTVEQ